MLVGFLLWGLTNSPLHKLLTANLNIFPALGLLNSIHAITMQRPATQLGQAEPETVVAR
jgi:hypothetical protein